MGTRDEFSNKVTSCTNDVKALEKRIEANSKGIDSGEVDKRVKAAKDELTTKINTDNKALEKRLDTASADIKKVSDLGTRVTKQEESLTKLQSTVTSLENSNKSGKAAGLQTGEDLKKEIDKVNQAIKDSMKGVEGKLATQETAITGLNSIKSGLTSVEGKIKEVTEKLSGQEKNYKTVTEKILAQEKGLKEVSEKIGKLDKTESSSKGDSSSSAKLVTLTKAIDSIQENSRSLETMVKTMKTELITSKDLEKLRSELSRSGPIDPNDAAMGPIMDSLIMTNDRPYIDCATLTPMTGTGLVKFEKFTAVNKLHWDDQNDQFIIQEPGVYLVFVTAILQDAALSIKLASNMMEREVFTVGSRDGLVGCTAPTYVCRSGLLQIDDDENVAETILVEIHADNEESFIDKNVSLIIYKIGESPGTD